MNRFSRQTVVLFNGSSIKGKNVRRSTHSLHRLLIPVGPTATVGEARIHGHQIPVVRIRGRSRWEQIGEGLPYSAD